MVIDLPAELDELPAAERELVAAFLAAAALDALAAALSRSVRLEQGRIYAGGLAKFAPREMERILVPAPGAVAR